MTMEYEVRLTTAERRALESSLADILDERIKRRIRGVLLLGGQLGLFHAAEEAGLSPATLQRWASRYSQSRSPDSLFSSAIRRHRYDGARELLAEVLKDSPREHGYDSGIWTLPLLRAHLASAEGVRIPPPVIARFMAQHTAE